MEDEEIDIQDSSTDVLDAEAVKDRTKLYNRLNEMSKDEREMLIKIVQYDTLMETLDAIKNMKKTKKETWQNIIKKLNALTGFNIGDGKFDFNAFLKVLIPLLGILAGCLLALRESEAADIEAAEPENNILTDGSIPALDAEKVFEKQKNKSVVLQYCDEKANGFSL